MRVDDSINMYVCGLSHVLEDFQTFQYTLILDSIVHMSNHYYYSFGSLNPTMVCVEKRATSSPPPFFGIG